MLQAFLLSIPEGCPEEGQGGFGAELWNGKVWLGFLFVHDFDTEFDLVFLLCLPTSYFQQTTPPACGKHFSVLNKAAVLCAMNCFAEGSGRRRVSVSMRVSVIKATAPLSLASFVRGRSDEGRSGRIDYHLPKCRV